MVPRRTPGEHFCPIPSPKGAAPHARGTLMPRSVAQRCRAARSGNISGTIRRPTGHYHTLGRHFCPVPSPNGAASHARGTLTPKSVAQGGRAARSGNISARFRRPRVPRRTPGEHFCPIPLPNSTAPHTRGTLLPVSVAQGCRTARPGDIYAQLRRPMVPRRTHGEHFDPFRRPTVPRSTPGEHFCHYPSPNSALPHARGTLRPVSVTQGCRAALPGDTYARFRRPTVHYRTPGRHFCPVPSPNGAAPHARATPTPVSVAGEGGGRETDGEGGTGDGREAGPGRSLGGVWAGDGDRHGNGNGNGAGDGHKSSRR